MFGILQSTTNILMRLVKSTPAAATSLSTTICNFAVELPRNAKYILNLKYVDTCNSISESFSTPSVINCGAKMINETLVQGEFVANTCLKSIDPGSQENIITLFTDSFTNNTVTDSVTCLLNALDDECNHAKPESVIYFKTFLIMLICASVALMYKANRAQDSNTISATPQPANTPPPPPQVIVQLTSTNETTTNSPATQSTANSDQEPDTDKTHEQMRLIS